LLSDVGASASASSGVSGTRGAARPRCTRVGAFFGELDILLEHSALSFSAVATEPTELFVLTKSTLLKRFSPGR
jgi:hypothetical protein